LLLRATALLWSIRVGLWLLPLGTVRRLLTRAGAMGPMARGRGPPKDRILWAVATAQCVVPRVTCLSQALATHILLVRSGYPAQVRIGVAKTDRGRLEAHAWVEGDGQILVGDVAGLSRYVRLPPLPDQES
jgi:hypothetical protein